MRRSRLSSGARSTCEANGGWRAARRRALDAESEAANRILDAGAVVFEEGADGAADVSAVDTGPSI